MSEKNPYLDAAIKAAAGDPSSPNVSDSLTFLLTRTLNANDPGACYTQDLIRAAAAVNGTQSRDACRRLKAKYGKDFHTLHWQADVRQAKAELATAIPSKLLENEQGNVRSILANAILQLQASPLKLAYDTFASKVMIQNTALWAKTGPWADIDDVSAANYLQHNGVNVSSATANEAAMFLAHQNPYHPVREWLQGLHWDGTPRADTWMSEYLGAIDTPLLQGVASKWMISAVARIMLPGCKADHMIVLEGPEGKRKSTALRALVNGHLDSHVGVQWFRDNMPPIDKDDTGLYMQGVWVIEIAELDAIRGKDWTKTKAFLTSMRDSFRKKFGRNMQDYPRQCIFAASTNEDHWAGDPHGARRFWPVRVGKVDIDGLLAVRDQLWAEARFRFDEGEPWHLPENLELLAKEEQAERAPDDIWIGRVSHALDRMPNIDDVSIWEIMDKMGLATKEQEFHKYKVGHSLQSLGWERYRSRTEGSRIYRYRKTGA